MYEELYEALTEIMPLEEALEYMKYLAERIKDNPERTARELNDFVFDKCISKNLCPHCFTKLQTKTYPEFTEYQGMPIIEKIHTKVCLDCEFEIE